MPLTPADVHNVVFKKPPIGKRGYDEDEVDAFLDEVERELARLIEENNELRAGASAAARAWGAPRPPAPARPPWWPPRRRCSSRARTTAPRLADARPGHRDGRPVRQRGQDAGRADAQRRQDQQRPADDRAAHEERADGRRGQAPGRHDARRRARRGRERDARAKAAALERDAGSGTWRPWAAWRPSAQPGAHIEELKAFEREYRTRLRAYLESHLRDLDSRGSAEPAQNSRQNQHAPA